LFFLSVERRDASRSMKCRVLVNASILFRFPLPASGCRLCGVWIKIFYPVFNANARLSIRNTIYRSGCLCNQETPPNSLTIRVNIHGIEVCPGVPSIFTECLFIDFDERYVLIFHQRRCDDRTVPCQRGFLEINIW
jgi:hypothetical protein